MITLLTAVGAVPTIIGTTEAIRHGQQQNERIKHRGRMSNLVVTLPRKTPDSALFDDSKVVLKNHKLYIETGAANIPAAAAQDPSSGTSSTTPGSKEAGEDAPGHLFCGFYYANPRHQAEWARNGVKGEGLVSTIRDDPPDLNWIYVDKDTLEVKYGSRAEAEGPGHLLGPWDCTERERRVTFEGWEGFFAVEEDPDAHPDVWALYFDRQNDGLGGRGGRRIAVLLSRCEPLTTKESSEE